LSQSKDRRPPTSNTGATRPITRPHTRPHPSVHTRGHTGSYRTRPTISPDGAEGPGSSATDRATALVKKRVRRRRLKAILLSVGLLLVVGGIGIWLMLSPTLQKFDEAINDIFVTPAPRQLGPDGTPQPPVYLDWGKEPVNILLLGLDLRPDVEDTRADTQIVVHIDPVSKSAAMFAIPRDLWVPIPGHGENRINTAYQTGEDDKINVPGGGPALAMATIEHNFGVPIHYFAQVDFTGFERVVDAMGGLTIDVPRPLVDNEYPLANEGVTRIYIPAGLQHMDGKTALQYARSRHADSDLGRNYRQQQVLLAMRQTGLNVNILSKLSDLAGKLSDAVKTDLSIPQVGSLAQLGNQIDADSIQTVLIDADMVYEYTIPETGAQVLMPRWELIRPKIAQAFADPKLAKEAARLSVQNGTTTGGIGKKLHDVLIAKGFFIPDLSAPPDQGSYPTTVIIDYTGGKKPHTLEALTTALGIDPVDVREGLPDEAPKANSDGKPVDILVVAGDDWIDKEVTGDQ
jgi:polyisoprenyl-teichoic acid--peptidoglycan teichoic acid transferase